MKYKFGLFSVFSKLAKDRLTSSSRLLARLLRDEDGSYILYMTMTMPILIGVMGLGTEGGLFLYNHRSLQSAADAAAYSAALACSYSTDYSTCAGAGITTQAKAVVASYGFTVYAGSGPDTNQANVTATPITFASQPAVQVIISWSQTALFSSETAFWSGIPRPVVSSWVSATAVLNGGSSNASGGCILGLGNNPSTGTNDLQNTISLQGNPNISVPNCGIFSDSKDCSSGSYSESLGGNATIGTSTNPVGSFGSAGCSNIFGNAKVYLPNSVTCSSSNASACTQGDGTLTDPYKGTTLPSSPTSCTQTNFSPSLNSTTLPLPPGRYCGATVFHGTGSPPPSGGPPSTIVLSTGVYIFDSTGNTGNNTTTLDIKNVTMTDEGAGATLVFTCSACGSTWPSQMMTIDSNASVCVTAPTTGTQGNAGFAIMGDPAIPLVADTNPTKAQFSLLSNPGNFFNGTVWTPTASFFWGGNATTAPSNCNYPTSGLPTFCLQLIANQISLGGTADYFGGAGCSLSGGSGGNIQTPLRSIVTLVD
jgi:Flp pilus assembly protein TadG